MLLLVAENSTGPKTESTPLPGGGAKETVLIYYEKVKIFIQKYHIS